MDMKTAITNLKCRIKDLSARQSPLKRLRKTTVLPHERSILAAKAVLPESREVSAADAAFLVRDQQALITASLNLYHELRGSEHRHGHGDEYLYCRADKKLRSELLAAR